MELTCEWCEKPFEKTNKRGPKPKFCSDSHRVMANRAKGEKKAADPPVRTSFEGLTLRDVVNVADLELSAKQCDVVIEAFTKARLRAVKRERNSS